MRIRVSKLVYLPVGGALAAGLVVSALVSRSRARGLSACYSVLRLRDDPVAVELGRSWPAARRRGGSASPCPESVSGSA